ncbi:hypothetical protein CRYUN_Cryun04dG0110200 [Craigia yunnanensis]
MDVRHKPQQLPPYPSHSFVVRATPPVAAPPSPKTNPPMESPKISEAPSDLDNPIPGSLGLVCSTWLVLGFSVWVNTWSWAVLKVLGTQSSLYLELN